MIDRTHLRNFLNSIPGLEEWSDSVEHLNGVEMVLNVLAEPTEGQINIAKRQITGFPRSETMEAIWKAMWSARFRGE